MMKVVIPAAGLGTRLLPVTKEIPKEMLPIFIKNSNGKTEVKPAIQLIFEELFDFGCREFCFIVGRGKRALEDHFSTDYNFVRQLKEKNKDDIAGHIEEFYRKIDDSTIVYINQPKPMGFGDAVYRAKVFTQNEPFIMHAGDDVIMSHKNDHFRRLEKSFQELDADAIFFVEEMADPREYGVIQGDEVSKNLYKIKEVFEKPKKPPTNLASIAVYMLKPIIYKALENVQPDINSEIQFADAIKTLLDWDCKVYAIKINKDEKRLDIGNPNSYMKVLMKS